MTENRIRYTLSKDERLYAQKSIDQLFAEGKSFIAYPLRVVYVITDCADDSANHVSIMVSVSKKKFKRAVKRNRIKRLVKEAYRLNKTELTHTASAGAKTINVAFLYLKNELPDYGEIEKAMHKALSILMDKIQEK